MTPPEFILRSIEPNDWPEVDRIQRAAFSAEAVEDIDTIQRLAELAPTTCLIAVSGSEFLGYLIAHPWIAEDLPPLNVMLPGLPESARTLFIHDLALAPEARGRGIAPALVRAGLARGRELGLTDASLLAIQNSSGFWQKQGFMPRPDLADTVRTTLHQFLQTEFVFMTRGSLE